ncbi:PAS domain-containing protein [Massilia putida]|uniref:PAS domain-containing protein n=1 Tax=Massilia putida TaxID=1141883 RepID=UPI000AA623E2|nr:PAS domain-containing protein [Massilia putida]
MPAVSAELLLMLMPLAAVIAILLGRQQQRLTEILSEGEGMRRAMLTLEAVFDQVPVGLAVLDLELRYVRTNRLLADFNGLPAEDHVGKSIYDFIPEIAPAVEDRVRQVAATGRSIVGTVLEGATAAEPHLRRVWRESMYPLYDGNDNLLGVTVAVEDITEQRRLAGALHESQRREQRRTSELEGLMQAAPAALFIAADRECRRVKANAAAERMLRLHRGQSPVPDAPGGRAFSVYAGATLLALDQMPLQRAAATGEEIRSEPLTVRFSNNERLHVVINALPLRDETGEVVGAVAGFVEAPASNAAIDA